MMLKILMYIHFYELLSDDLYHITSLHTYKNLVYCLVSTGHFFLMFLHNEFAQILLVNLFYANIVSMSIVCVVLMTCLVSQMIASKYLNDEGETESVLNSEWAKISKCYCRCVLYVYIQVKFSL